MTYLFAALVVAYTLAAAVSDWSRRRIPNYLTVPAAIGGLAFHTFAPSGWGLLTSLAGFAVGFSLLFVPWLMGGGGMGDVKLLAALGAWLGPQWTLAAFALSMAAAAFAALAVLTWHAVGHGWSAARGRYMPGAASDSSPRRRRARVLPFAVPVAVCTWLVVFWLVQRGMI